MKKQVRRLILSLFLVVLFTGCSSNAAKTAKKAKPKKVKITAQLVVDKLRQKEGQYMTDVSVVTAENDPNKLLGRPNQYTEKITWKDNRSKDSNVDCSIEVFKNKTDAETRKKYIEAIIKSMPMLTQYIQQNNNSILRIDGVLTPDQSNEYMDIYKKIK